MNQCKECGAMSPEQTGEVHLDWCSRVAWSAPTPKYEYEYHRDMADASLLAVLNEAGAAGWEVIHMESYHHVNDPIRWRVVYRRLKYRRME